MNLKIVIYYIMKSLSLTSIILGVLLLIGSFSFFPFGGSRIFGVVIFLLISACFIFGGIIGYKKYSKYIEQNTDSLDEIIGKLVIPLVIAFAIIILMHLEYIIRILLYIIKFFYYKITGEVPADLYL